MLTARATTMRWRIIGILYAISLLFLLFQGGKTSFMLFCIFNVLAIYLVFGRWSGIGSVTGVRHLVNGTAQTGEQTLLAGTRLEVNLHIQIPGVWPIPYVLVRDRLLDQNGSAIPFETSFVPSYRRLGVVSFMTPPLERGIYRFAPTECSTRDIFGLFEHTGNFESSASFSVYPRIVPIRQWQLFKRGSKGPYSTSASRLSSKETTQINGVREYIYGDRLSRIHWNATARTGQWKSKEFERESLPRTVFVLDRYAGTYERQDQFELAVSVTASMLEFGFRRSSAMGLVSTGKKQEGFAPHSKSDQRAIILNHLVRIQADGDTPLYRALRESTSLVPTGSLAVIISPQAGEETVRSMEWLSKRGVMPVLVHLKGKGDSIKDNGDQQWLRLLQRGGFIVHPISTLQELPKVLEGGIA
ncbi:hypothetical protein Back11_26940 [Paenibacillus baekrokdamisoli]|uniref:DUF58 domain-containing protein n=1 Tax=Paenibacillus baekrokdamisoli TaxID=1712516 RepID=A0A3G9JED5_9BACL|nr:DUF58 domain-containing protein [Paenibacillus baekrokdamisoli]MBB3070343.1 uncharacterized protein (DUF58 family) [Paenibacillus baekrokdamisoli]BBH21349.1 hypothetical protein Back11_26940 [Paenibacillus baekrokdamisoli]